MRWERTGARSHYCHGNTDKSNSAANTTLCESFSEIEPKTGRNGNMKSRVWGSPQAACISPPVSSTRDRKEAFLSEAEESLYAQCAPSAERDVKCPSDLYMQVGWVTGSSTGWFRGGPFLLNTYCMGHRDLR